MTRDQTPSRTRGWGMRGVLGAFTLYCAAVMLLLCRPGLLTGTDYLGYDTDPLVYIWVAEIPDETVSAAAYQPVSAHLQALKQAAQCTLKQGAHRLDPDTAVAAGCLALAYRSSLAGTAVNWDRMGGWLGFFGQGVAVGVMTDSTIAKQLAVAAGPGLETILFPYPETYDPKANDTNRSGQFLPVHNVQTLLDDRSGND